MSKTIDFDAFRQERNREPVHLVIGGITYDLPPSIPAAVAIEVIALKKDLGEETDVPVDTLSMIGKAIFGESLWAKVLAEHRVDLDELPMLIGMVLEAYSPVVKDDASDPQ